MSDPSVIADQLSHNESEYGENTNQSSGFSACLNDTHLDDLFSMTLQLIPGVQLELLVRTVLLEEG